MLEIVTFDEMVEKTLRNDPACAAALLNDILQDGDPAEMLLALGHIQRAFGGGMAEVAQSTGLNKNTLYRTLSEQGNPRLDTLVAILRSMGLALAVRPLEPRAAGVYSGG